VSGGGKKSEEDVNECEKALTKSGEIDSSSKRGNYGSPRERYITIGNVIDEVLADNKASNHGRQHAQDPQHH